DSQEEAGDRLVELEQDVPDESVRHQNIAGARDDVATLDVADEVEVGRREKAMRLYRKLITLLRLLADVQQPDPRIRPAQHVMGVYGTQARELYQVRRLAVHVGAGIHHDHW